MDTSNSDVSPTDFQKNASKWNWILQSASVDNLLEALQFLKEQNEESYDATTAKITERIEPAIKSASYGNLIKALHLSKNRDDNIYDDAAGKIAAALATHVMNNELIS